MIPPRQRGAGRARVVEGRVDVNRVDPSFYQTKQKTRHSSWDIPGTSPTGVSPSGAQSVSPVRSGKRSCVFEFLVRIDRRLVADGERRLRATAFLVDT